MEQARSLSQQAEGLLNKVSAPVRPYLSHIGRFLLVVTFLEDVLRIYVQWNDQIRFMEYYRGFPRGLSHFFLAYNMIAMLVGSFMALARFHTPWACLALTSVVVAQSLGYGLLFHLSFMLRNISLIGGILLLLAESMSLKSRSVNIFPGLPNLSETERGTYVSLFGRILLIFLFGSLMLSGGELTPLRIIFAILSFIASVMVAIGFKAKYSAMLLVAFLCVFNVFINQWWMHNPDSPERDFMRYDFFQTLSIIGGFLILANTGPGELSLDEKKKRF